MIDSCSHSDFYVLCICDRRHGNLGYHPVALARFYVFEEADCESLFGGHAEVASQKANAGGGAAGSRKENDGGTEGVNESGICGEAYESENATWSGNESFGCSVVV